MNPMKRSHFLMALILSLATLLSACAPPPTRPAEDKKARAERLLAEQERQDRIATGILAIQIQSDGLEKKIKEIQLQNNQAVAELQAANRELKSQITALQKELGLDHATESPMIDDGAKTMSAPAVPAAKVKPAPKPAKPQPSGADTDAGWHPLLRGLTLLIIIVAIFFMAKLFIDRIGEDDEPFFDEDFAEDSDETVETSLGTVTVSSEAINDQKKTEAAEEEAPPEGDKPDKEI